MVVASLLIFSPFLLPSTLYSSTRPNITHKRTSLFMLYYYTYYYDKACNDR